METTSSLVTGAQKFYSAHAFFHLLCFPNECWNDLHHAAAAVAARIPQKKNLFNESLINTVVTIFVSSYYKFKHGGKYRKADSRVIFCMVYIATTLH